MHNFNYFLALNRIPKVGPRTVVKLLKRWPDLETMFALSAKELTETGLPIVLAQAIADFKLTSIEPDLRWNEVQNQHLLTWDSPAYPLILKEIHDPPVVLYARGNLTAFEKPGLAIVGTRKPSATGSENARHFAKVLAENQLTIVSGLALGVDAKAHEACLEVNESTIAVMGTGIDCIYPYRHRKLADKITENGLLISEFPLKSPPIAGHFPRRNRIISGLSLATLIIEAAVRSGSLITARFALEQNRDVLAIPGSIHNPQAQGCHFLLQQGARLITSVNDVLEALQITPSDPISMKAVKEIQPEKDKLIEYIGYEATSIDQMMMRSQENIETITCKLAMLELQGLIKAVPGGYIRCEYER